MPIPPSKVALGVAAAILVGGGVMAGINSSASHKAEQALRDWADANEIKYTSSSSGMFSNTASLSGLSRIKLRDTLTIDSLTVEGMNFDDDRKMTTADKLELRNLTNLSMSLLARSENKVTVGSIIITRPDLQMLGDQLAKTRSVMLPTDVAQVGFQTARSISLRDFAATRTGKDGAKPDFAMEKLDITSSDAADEEKVDFTITASGLAARQGRLEADDISLTMRWDLEDGALDAKASYKLAGEAEIDAELTLANTPDPRKTNGISGMQSAGSIIFGKLSLKMQLGDGEVATDLRADMKALFAGRGGGLGGAVLDDKSRSHVMNLIDGKEDELTLTITPEKEGATMQDLMGQMGKGPGQNGLVVKSAN